jgi:RNA polymerase sigma-70 factor (ECF subfamily)
MLFKITRGNKENRPEEVLLNEFRSTGDLEILGRIYSGYMHLVYGVCLKYLKDREESKDAVMQIFEKLIVEIPKHKIENFKSWLHVVTKNYCLMQLRSEKSHQESYEDWIKEGTIFMEMNEELHPIDSNGAEIDKALENCIERLKVEQKECILQFYYMNKSYNEISVILDLDEKKVKSNLQNAKRNLKLCLEGKNESEK